MIEASHGPRRDGRLTEADRRPRVAVVGAGAAGLMAAIHAARSGQCLEVVVLDSARTLGAKILISGGGRCNVTHHAVDETAFSGSTRPAIRKVLRRFDVAPTVEFFAAQGGALKREETGKLFPGSDAARARTAWSFATPGGWRLSSARTGVSGCTRPRVSGWTWTAWCSPPAGAACRRREPMGTAIPPPPALAPPLRDAGFPPPC